MTTFLVTGSHGWVGGHLRRILRARGHQVIGVGRRPRTVGTGERYLRVDLRDGRATSAAVDAIRPDVVVHLAAVLPQRVADVDELIADVVPPTYHLCRALRAVEGVDRPPRLVVVGSSAQYGAVPRELNPVTEEVPALPLGAYGHAKAAAESLALAMGADGRISVTAARPFNHVGPGEGTATVAGALARRVADVATGRLARVRAADLDAVRDFTDVRDVARAYADMADAGRPGRTYNVCSGRGVSVGAVLRSLLDTANLDESVVDIAEGGTGGVRHQVGSAARLTAEVGWKPERELRESLGDLLGELAGRHPTDEEGMR